MLVCAFGDLALKEMKVNKQQHCLRSERLGFTVNETTVLSLNGFGMFCLFQCTWMCVCVCVSVKDE